MKAFLVFVFLFQCIFNFGQEYHGIVLDENYLGIENAKVYYPGTTIFTKTNAQGEFRIKTISSMRELVFSHSDYNTITLNLNITKPNERINVILTQKFILPTIVAQAISEEDKKFYLIKFKNILLGNSANGKSCVIKNEDMIRFNYNKQNKVLNAHALEPLIIENKKLGYEIQYDLVDFEWNIKSKSAYYAGFPLFKEKHNKRKKRFHKRRIQAFNGSLQHFIQSVYRGDYLQQGFEVRKLVKKKNPNYPSDSAIAKAKRNIKNKQKISLAENDTDMKILRAARTQNKFVSYLYKPLLNREDFIMQKEGQFFFKFDDYLNIEYVNEKEPNEYIATLPFSQQNFVRNQTSLLWITDDVQIIENGLYEPTHYLWVTEYLGFEKLGDMVPADFVVE